MIGMNVNVRFSMGVKPTEGLNKGIGRNLDNNLEHWNLSGGDFLSFSFCMKNLLSFPVIFSRAHLFGTF